MMLGLACALHACGPQATREGGTSVAYDAVYEAAGDEAKAVAAAPPAAPGEPLASAQTTPTANIATDANVARAQLLIYTGTFQMSVFEVDKSQREMKALAGELGGFVAQQTQTRIVIRIPAPRFEDAVARIEHLGKVLGRQIEALDVGDQYRDLALRLRTLEAMRTRLEELLARAGNVKEALEVEKELERVLSEIEQLKGQLRSLDDRIAYSTLTVDFMPTPQPELDQGAVFRLPFPWLEELGVHSLLEVTR